MSGLYVKLDAEYASDDKMIEVGPLAELLYIRGLCFAKRTMLDGKISRGQLASVAIGIPNPTKHVQRLVAAGLWTALDSCWWQINPLRSPTSPDERAEIRRRRWRVYCGRHEVFEHDGYTCVRCGAAERLEVDHIVPIVRGGSDASENLQTLCKSCNASKKDR